MSIADMNFWEYMHYCAACVFGVWRLTSYPPCAELNSPNSIGARSVH